MRLVADHVPPPGPAELIAGLLAGQTHLHSLGITRFQDACVGAAGELGMPDSFETYLMAADYGMLSSHVVGALWWDRRRGLSQIDDLLARREQAGDGQFRATTVKLMLDGVCETFTAAMSAPYLDRDGHPGDHQGRLFIDPETLREATGRLAAAGFQLHFHAIGDRAVSTALDALEALPAAQRQAARHHLAHLQFITPAGPGPVPGAGRRGELPAALGVRGDADAGADHPVRRAGARGLAVPDRRAGPRRDADRVRQRLAGIERRSAAGDPRGGQPGPVRTPRPTGETGVRRPVPARSGDHPGRRDRRLHLRGRLGQPRGGPGRDADARACGPTWPCSTRTCSRSRPATSAAPRSS